MSFDDKTLKRLELEMAIHEIVESTGLIMEIQVETAKLCNNYYKELISSGFTETQALELVKVHGFHPPIGGGR